VGFLVSLTHSFSIDTLLTLLSQFTRHLEPRSPAKMTKIKLPLKGE